MNRLLRECLDCQYGRGTFESIDPKINAMDSDLHGHIWAQSDQCESYGHIWAQSNYRIGDRYCENCGALDRS